MNTRRQFLLGVFFLTSLSILVFYTLFFTNFTLFERVRRELVYFPEISGLREGDPVMVAGLRIGRVGQLQFDLNAPRDRRIKAELRLEQPVQIHQGYSISIRETTMLGGHHVEIEPGAFDAPPLQRTAGEPLMGAIAPNPFSALGTVGDLVEKNSATVTDLLDQLRDVVRKVNEGQGPAGRIVNDVQLGNDLEVAIKNLRTVTENLAQATADINAGRGVVGALLHDDQLASDIKSTVSDIQNLASELNAGRGTFGRFLKDDSLADEFERAVRSIADFAKNLDEGQGLIARMANDPKLANDVTEIVANAKTASEDLSAVLANVRSGEGTAGKLLMSDELYEEIRNGVALLTRSLEDYREAAPITALTGVIFSAF